MTGIILADRPATDSQSQARATLTFSGVTVIQRQINAMLRAGVEKLIVVLGCDADRAYEIANAHKEQTELMFINNHLWSHSGPITGFWYGVSEIKRGSALVMHGDLLFDPRIVGLVLEPEGDTLAVAESQEQLEPLSVNQSLIALDGDPAGSLGLMKLSADMCQRLDSLIDRATLPSTSTVEEVLQLAIERDKAAIQAVSVESYKWFRAQQDGDASTVEMDVLPHIE